MGKEAEDKINLEEVAEMTDLDASDRGIVELDGIEHLSNATVLNLHENQISDISPLAVLTNLTDLSLFSNQISDISPLAALTNRTRLDVSGNQITDIFPLVENSGLGEGDEVVLENNLVDLSEGSEDLENIRLLEARGVVVQY